MNKKICLKDLDCYKNASDKEKNHQLIKPERGFDLSYLPTEEIQQEMEDFINWRGKVVSAMSIRSEFYPFNQFSRFLSEVYSDIQSFRGIDIATMERKYKTWLLKNNKSISQIIRSNTSRKKEIREPEGIIYLRKLYRYFNVEDDFSFDKDVWILDKMDIELRKNPVKSINSISFSKIPQDNIKKEIKQIILLHLKQKALGTVTAEITAINRFTTWLYKEYKDILTLKEMDREVLEDYLSYTNTEANRRKSYAKDLRHLKSVFNTAACILEDPEIGDLFIKYDIGRVPEKLFESYTDDELRRLNKALVERDEQVARVLFIHQMLGTRISETLTLQQDCIQTTDDGKIIIQIVQVKTGREYDKPINKDIQALIEKSIEYTVKKYGKRKYVFVSDKDPDKPMQYGKIQYHLMAMVQENNLRDDSGELFGVGTHIWRHTYGQKLTEMHVDDLTISKLLGHASSGNVKYYRKMGNSKICAETKEMRDEMDKMLKEITKGWDM